MKDGDKLGRECPRCNKHELEFYMGFADRWSDRSGHYTVDVPMIICPDEECGYEEGYDEVQDQEGEHNF